MRIEMPWLRLAYCVSRGIEPVSSGDGLGRIAPQVPPDYFVSHLPLLRLKNTPHVLPVSTEPSSTVPVWHVCARLPTRLELSATIDGHPIETPQPNTSEVASNFLIQIGTVVPFEVRWNA